MTVLLALALAAGGLRHPAAWSLGAAALWLGARRVPLAAPPALPLWLAWLGWSALSALLSPEPLRSLAALAEPATALLVMSWAAALPERERRRWFWYLAAAAPALAVAAVAIPNALFPRTGLLPPYYNYTAAFEAAAIAAIAAAAGSRALRGRDLALAALVAGVAAAEIAWVGSRGAAFAAAAGAAVALARAGRRRWLVALSVVAAIALAAAATGPGRAWLKLDRPWANRRPALWSSALAIAAERPFLGVGPGRFGRGYLRHPVVDDSHATRFGLRTDHAHSEALQAAAESGWIGFALLALAWTWTLRSALARRRGWTEAAAFAAAAAWTAQALVDNLFALPALRLWYAAALGIASGAAPRRGVRRAALPAPALAAGLVFSIAGRWPDAVVARLRARAEAAPPPRSAELMSRARMLAPSDPELYASEARAAFRAGSAAAPAAERALRRAFELAPYHALYPQMLAESAAARRDWEESLGWSRAASALEPDFLEARLVEAESLAELGRRGEAVAAARALEDARRRVESLPPKANDYDRLVTTLDRARRGRLLQRLGLEAEPLGEAG